MSLPHVLQAIKPAFPGLLHLYSQPGTGSMSFPERPPEIGPELPDTPTRKVNLAANRAWGQELRRAAESCI